MGLFSFFSREKKESLDKGMFRTREGFFSKLGRIISGRPKIDDTVLGELEEALITSDVGVETTLKIIQRLEERVKLDKNIGTEHLNSILREEISLLMAETNNDNPKEITIPKTDGPYVIMVVGVNGVGKTTTIGKLAYQLKQQGKNVMLGAADTFRAAAVDQLKIWSERAGVPIVQQGMGADPASVAFDTLQSAKAQGIDVVLIDTAGRLHNKVNLMNELGKV
jgi:fused signal recognition particle receptor